MTDEHYPDAPPPEMFRAEYWDERFSAPERIWSGNPNLVLVAEVRGLAPGRALEVGSGEGDDARWLAEQGWEVTATDISAVALEKAAARVAEQAPGAAARITWRRADSDGWTPPEGAYDLVTSHYLPLRPERRTAVFSGLAAAVAPGGTLLLVSHALRDLEDGLPRPPWPELFPTLEEMADLVPGRDWETAVLEERPRPAVYDGTEYTIHDVVLRARRRD
ncbi:class I SAM-dependent methyltransferase [Nocardiopsis flavescens]|uniref:Methyltransferase domain-containing protein n=1 Tax=Nocardiopsis flavescens TaxID=758803 RepID=A0A1M6N3I5_9ACTN|nr:class I SAM-dependent methyltransferase [Nocardiopsis flavescens]SHJ90331.1 Methyltransferase domain-containing protein [Nocardiopsis flavescens]